MSKEIQVDVQGGARNPKLRQALLSIAKSSSVKHRTRIPETPTDAAKLFAAHRDELERATASGALSNGVLESFEQLRATTGGPSVQEVYQGTRLLFTEAMLGAMADPISDLAWYTQSDGASEKFRLGGDVPEMEKIVGGEREFATLANADFEIRNEKFGAGITMHEDDLEDDRIGVYEPFVNQLGQNAASFPARYIGFHLLNGFTGNLFPEKRLGAGTAYTGAQFFSAAHSMMGGPVQNNLVGAVALTEANLQIADLKLRGMRTWKGDRTLGMKGTTLIVGPKQEKAAIELIKSLWIINAGGTANRDNAFWYGRYTVMVSERIEIGSPQENWWFLADLSKPVIWQMRRPIRSLSPNGPDSEPLLQAGQLRFAVDARAGIGFFEPRCIVGANPASG
jgi:phage major head subunit gpT-like protein